MEYLTRLDSPNPVREERVQGKVRQNGCDDPWRMCRLPVEFAFSIEAEAGNCDGSIAQE